MEKISDMELEKRISENLKREIELCGKPKSVIADELGISRPTLSQYLSGRVFPSLPTFAKLCKIIDCSADEILGL